jgi:hypothetical protein
MERPKFYINPLTSRMIKSTARTFKKLKKDKYVIDKHKCLYNIKSAERCFNKLLKLYPDIVHPSSNFIDIPKTYKRGSIRAFIDDKKKIKGYVDKTGKKYRLKKSIQKNIYKNKRVPVVKDFTNNLKNVVDKLPKIDDIQQKIVEDQLKYDKPIKRLDDINIIFNPLQNDFISVNQKLNNQEIESILEIVNGELIPNKLLPISKNFDFSGIIKDNEQIYGLVDTSNQIKRFDKPIKIKEKKLDIPEKSEMISIPETEKSDTISIPESLLKTQDTDTISIPDTISTLSEEPSIVKEEKPIVKQEEKLVVKEEEKPIVKQEEPSIVKEEKPIVKQEEKLVVKQEEKLVVKEEEKPIVKQEEKLVVKEEEKPIVKQEEKLVIKEEEKPVLQIEKEYIENLPEVEFIKSVDVKGMEDKLVESPVIESEDIIKKIKCLDGSQFDVNENRCISCDKYGLVWDPEYMACKIMLKEDIKKIVRSVEDDDDYTKVKMKIVIDNKDKILGYLE